MSKRGQTSRRIARWADYLLWRHPGLMVFYSRKTIFWAIGTTTLIIGSTFYYAVSIKSPTDNGVLDNLIATPLQALIALLILAIVIYIRLRALTDVRRINPQSGENYNEECLSIKFSFLSENNNATIDTTYVGEIKPLSELIEACIRYLPVDPDDLFRFEAGGLDIPKVSLRSIYLDEKGQLVLCVGSCSFRSVFFSHYFADFPLARESVDEENGTIPTLRKFLTSPVRKWTARQLENWKSLSKFECFPHLPNPLGVTGVCRVRVEDSNSQQFEKWILRKRGHEVIGDMNTLDWSFSGLVECFDFLAHPAETPLPIVSYFASELQDEVLGTIPYQDVVISTRPLSLLFNEKYLFQPELILLVELRMSSEQYAAISNSPGLIFWNDDELARAVTTPERHHVKAMFWQISKLITTEIDIAK